MIFAKGDDGVFGSQALAVAVCGAGTVAVPLAVWRALHGAPGLLQALAVPLVAIGLWESIEWCVRRVDRRVDVRQGERRAVCSPAGFFEDSHREAEDGGRADRVASAVVDVREGWGSRCAPAGDVWCEPLAQELHVRPASETPGLVRAVVPSAPVPARGAAAHGRGSGLPPASARMVRAVRDTRAGDDRADGGTAQAKAVSDEHSLTAPISSCSSPTGTAEAGVGAVGVPASSPRTQGRGL